LNHIEYNSGYKFYNTQGVVLMAKKLNAVQKKTKQLIDVITRRKSDPVVQTTTSKQTHINIGQYSSSELQQLLPSNTRTAKTSELRDFLTESNKKSQTIIKELKCLKALAPEIEDAKRIYVSSIMSPNDMQKNSVRVSVNLKELPEIINTDISNELNTFFNESYELGVNLTKWLGECFYETGAKAIVVLPRSNIDILMQSTSMEHYKLGSDKNVNLASLEDISWKFTTASSSTDKCEVGGVLLSPATYTATTKDEPVAYGATPTDTTHQCIALDCEKYSWGFSSSDLSMPFACIMTPLSFSIGLVKIRFPI